MEKIKLFFEPQSVALIGATDRENAVGRTVLNENRGMLNLARKLGFTIKMISPEESNITLDLTE